MKLRLIALLVLGSLVACGGAGPGADEGKSNDEIRKAADGMSAEDLQKVIEEYGEAIKTEKDDAKLKALQEKSAIYAEVLAKKKLGGG